MATPSGGKVESDTALPGLAVHEERVELGNVHDHRVAFAQVDVFQVVLVTLVLGKIYKHLDGRKRNKD